MDKVIAAGLQPSQLEENVRVLTDEIGGRVPGTPEMKQAVEFAVKAFKAAGADSVKTESFHMPVYWEEGATEVMVTAPTPFKVRATSMAWTPAIAKPLVARVVDVGMGGREDFAKAGNVAGAIVLVHSDILRTWDDLFAEYQRAPGTIQSALDGKAAAIAFLSSRENDILYRHINVQDGKLDRMPAVLVAREDGERIARLLAQGKKVSMSLYVPNKVGSGFESKNVVAEIRGSERPDEFVILGAHLDSWNLGTGALDNGANAMLVVDALRAIKASGVTPRRSIRCILFSGEEEGLLGSRAYAHSHRAELDKAAGVVIFDTGTGQVTGFSLGGRSDIAAAVQSLMEPLGSFGATGVTTDAFVGTDNFDFLLEGVPTLVANQKEANYLVNYHATSDTFDKADLPLLRKHVAIAAGMTFAIADAPEGIGSRQGRNEIEKLLGETKLDVQMKTLGIWPDWEGGTRGRTE